MSNAATQADEMAEILARANGEKGDNGASKIIRDQAYTHLKEAMDEVRATGKYVFWKDNNRVKGNTSNYNKG